MRTLDCYPAGIIEPAQTRAVVSIALAAAAHAPVAPTDFGVFRMTLPLLSLTLGRDGPRRISGGRLDVIKPGLWLSACPRPGLAASAGLSNPLPFLCRGIRVFRMWALALGS
eukprot:scaffold11103_cov69-Phaeocystis_antarctica.AAC.5